MNKLKIYLSVLIMLAAFQTTYAQGSGTGDPVFVNPGGTNTLDITAYFVGPGPSAGVITHIRITAFPTYTTSLKIGGTLYTSATFPAAGVTFPIGTTVLLDPMDGTNSPLVPFKVINTAGTESAATTNLIIMLVETPDLTPTIDIDGLDFPVTGTSKDFVVNVYEVNGGDAGNPITVKINKLSAFTITYPAASGLSDVYGGVTNENSNWTFTETATTITATAKPGVTIAPYGSVVLGFTITRNANIAHAIQNLTATIGDFSGGETNTENNTAIIIVTASAN